MLSNVVFSDENISDISGYVNHCNVRIQRADNYHATAEHSKDSLKATAFCALSNKTT
jgi:hypothetical protein